MAPRESPGSTVSISAGFSRGGGVAGQGSAAWKGGGILSSGAGTWCAAVTGAASTSAGLAAVSSSTLRGSPVQALTPVSTVAIRAPAASGATSPLSRMQPIIR